MENTNILAVNDKILERADFYEFLRAQTRDRTIIWSVLIYAAAGIVYAISIAQAAAGGHPSPLPVIIMTILVLLMFLIRYALPILPAKKRFEAYKEKGPAQRIQVYYADRVETRIVLETLNRVYYKDLDRVILANKLLILIKPDHSYLLCRTDGFRGGTFEDVYKAIEAVHPKIEAIKKPKFNP